MSRVAISLLPPFMNFESFSSWVDDFVKRLLHEAIGDLDRTDLETVTNAKFTAGPAFRVPPGLRKRTWSGHQSTFLESWGGAFLYG